MRQSDFFAETRIVAVAEGKFRLRADFKPAGDQPQAIAELSGGLEQGLRHQVLLGVTGSGKTYTIANVVQAAQTPTIVMAPNRTLAAQLYGEFREFFPDNAVEYFVSYYDYYQPEAYVPSSDTYIEKDSSVNEHIEQMRLSATKALLERRDVLVVATVSAIYGIGAPEDYFQMVLHAVVGERVDRRKLLGHLAQLQYTRNDVDFRRGAYRVRGDVIDVFPAESMESGVRIALFDDEIESITRFDPLTGEAREELPRVTIYPKTHYVAEPGRMRDMAVAIEKELELRLKELHAQNKLLEEQRLGQRTRYDLEMIRELGYCTGIENYSRHLSGRAAGEPPPTLLDYLPDDALTVVDESHVGIPQLRGMYRGDRSRKETLVNYGFRLPSALDNRPLRFEEWEAHVGRMILVSATPGPWERERADRVVEQVVRPTGLVDPKVEVRPAATQVDDLLEEIRVRAAKQQRVLATTLTKRMAEDLCEYLRECDVRVRYMHSDIDTVERIEIIQGLRRGDFDVLVGINLLREGLDLPEVSLVAVLDADREGFLRSESSLIQTIGRAARNLQGMAILYADRRTGSIEAALKETARRRKQQMAFNRKHKIRPRGIQKEVVEILSGVMLARPVKSQRADEADAENAAPADRPALPAEDLGRRMRELENEMHRRAAALEFEEAARLRDELEALREAALTL